MLRMDERSLILYREALKYGKEKVYNIRIMVVGPYGVGKTTLVRRLLGKDVNIAERKSTEGIDIHMHCADVSLASQKWTVQDKDADKLKTLHRLVKQLNEKLKMDKMSQELEQIRETRGAYVSKGRFENDGSSEENVPNVNVKGTLETEILQMLVENADKIKSVEEDKAALSMWDFAGQFIYYTTHQAFLTRRAVYLLVIDLSQQITDLVKDDECFFDRDGILACKIHDLVEVWMNSIHTCSPSSEARTPPVILVGTHADMIPENVRKNVCESIFNQVRYLLRDKQTRFHLIDEDFVIDNTVLDPKLDDLKKKIVELASQQPFWGEEVPARWLHLEQALMKLKAAGVKVIPYSLVESINKAENVQIETKEELDLFLRFLHEMGTIFYLNSVKLRDKVVLVPQWFINALKSLITAEMFVKKQAIIDKWYEFKESGKLTPELIDAVWTKSEHPDLYDNKEHILLLMEHMNILARPRSFSENGEEIQAENYYIAPCMLRQTTPREFISPEPNSDMESTSVLCYAFKEKFLPPPIFHRLIAACLASWPIAKQKLENLIFCGFCLFALDPSHRLYLHFKEYVIFTRITRMGIKKRTPNVKICSQVREFITAKLSDILGCFGQRLEFELCIQCPRADGDSVHQVTPLSVLQENEELSCDFHEKSHAIVSRDLLRFWFEDEVPSGEVKVDPPSILLRHILDTVPRKTLLNRLSMKIGKEFLQLGLELDVSMSRIEQIQMENPTISMQCFKILQEWVRKNGSQATFRNLERACRCVGIDVLSEVQVEKTEKHQKDTEILKDEMKRSISEDKSTQTEQRVEPGQIEQIYSLSQSEKDCKTPDVLESDERKQSVGEEISTQKEQKLEPAQTEDQIYCLSQFQPNSSHLVPDEEIANMIKEQRFTNISEMIKSSRKEVKHVWVGYRKSTPELPILIVVLFNVGYKLSREDLPKPFRAYECLFRHEYEVNDEASKICNNPKKWRIEERDLKTLVSIRDKIDKLLEKHSNIEMIGYSGVRSRNYGSNDAQLIQETCIVIYVHVKGIIPIGETEFQGGDFDFPIDVREGKFLFYDDHRTAKEYHHNLVMGCQIAGNRVGTLGGFLDLPQGGVACLTCAHLFRTEEEAKSFLDYPKSEQEKHRKAEPWRTVRVGQPDHDHDFGTVRGTVLRPGSSTEVGIDAAIVTITETHRLPTSGTFPKDDHRLSGYPPGNPMQFQSGNCRPIGQNTTRCEVLKFGASTEITRGLLSHDYLLVGLSNIQELCFGYRLYNQMAVLPLKPFQGFAAPGDSGALVFMAKNGNQDDLVAIGMVVGGSTAGETFVTPIMDILRAFNLDRILNTECFKSFVQYCPSQQNVTLEDLKKELEQQRKQIGEQNDKNDRQFKETNEKIDKLIEMVTNAFKEKK